MMAQISDAQSIDRNSRLTSCGMVLFLWQYAFQGLWISPTVAAVRQCSALIASVRNGTMALGAAPMVSYATKYVVRRSSICVPPDATMKACEL